jgi:hypothetical protein
MLRVFSVLLPVCCLGLIGCGNGATGKASSTSTDGQPTTETNVRPDYKQRSMGQNPGFTSEQEAVKSLPPGYSQPGEQQRNQ